LAKPIKRAKKNTVQIGKPENKIARYAPKKVTSNTAALNFKALLANLEMLDSLK
jgi:hypothetical protein